VFSGHRAHGHAIAKGAPLELMIAAAARPVEAARVTLTGHDGKLWAIGYSYDDRLIAKLLP